MKNRDEFLISKSTIKEVAAEASTPAKRAKKREAPAKRVKVAAIAKRTERKVAATGNRAVKAAGSAATGEKATAKKAAS